MVLAQEVVPMEAEAVILAVVVVDVAANNRHYQSISCTLLLIRSYQREVLW